MLHSLLSLLLFCHAWRLIMGFQINYSYEKQTEIVEEL